MKPSKYLEGQRDRLEQVALAYARMKLFGITLEKDGSSSICNMNDAKMYAEYQLKNLGMEAERLLHELSATELPPRKPEVIL